MEASFHALRRARDATNGTVRFARCLRAGGGGGDDDDVARAPRQKKGASLVRGAAAPHSPLAHPLKPAEPPNPQG